MWELVGEQVEMCVGCLAGEGTKAFSITLHPASLSLVCSYVISFCNKPVVYQVHCLSESYESL